MKLGSLLPRARIWLLFEAKIAYFLKFTWVVLQNDTFASSNAVRAMSQQSIFRVGEIVKLGDPGNLLLLYHQWIIRRLYYGDPNTRDPPMWKEGFFHFFHCWDIVPFVDVNSDMTLASVCCIIKTTDWLSWAHDWIIWTKAWDCKTSFLRRKTTEICYDIPRLPYQFAGILYTFEEETSLYVTYYIQVCHTASADVLSYRLEFLSLFGQQETGANPRKSLESNF